MRARNIKPAFFKNPDLADAGPHAQLLFAGLWCLADREGRLKDKPRVIKAEVFPFYDVDVNRELTVIERLGFVRRYVANGERVIEVLNFKLHQRPHHTEKASSLPSYDDVSDCSVSTPDINGELTVNSPLENGEYPPDSLIPDSLIPDSLNHESIGEEKPRRKRRSPIPADFELSESMREYALKRYPDMDTAQTFAHFKDHHTNKGTLGLDWEAGWRTWVNQAERMGYARAKRREPLATASRKVAPSEVFDRQPHGPGTVHGGVVAGAKRDGGRDDPPLGKAGG